MLAILSHPNFPVDGLYGLADLLSDLVQEDMPAKFVSVVLSHPNALSISDDSTYSFVDTLEMAVTENKIEHIKAFLSHPNFVIKGDRLGKAVLAEAIFNKNVELAQLILSSPHANTIPAESLRAPLQVALGLSTQEPKLLQVVLSHPNCPADGDCGLGDLLSLAIANDLPIEITEAILSHPNAPAIPSRNSRYSLEEALKAASHKNKPELVALISSRLKE
jgi:hypothetical protein